VQIKNSRGHTLTCVPLPLKKHETILVLFDPANEILLEENPLLTYLVRR